MKRTDSHGGADRARLIAFFRYGVLAPLLEDTTHAEDEASTGRLSALAREIADRDHFLPGKGRIRVALRTVYAWLKRYREGGLDALQPQRRKDRGRSRKIDDELLKRAIALRKEIEQRTTTTLLDILKLEGAITDKPNFHRATLDRALDNAEASRRRLKTLGGRRHIKMHFENFGALWVGDYHHGPLVLGPDGKPHVAKLGAFLDHATRFPVADRYYLDEKLTSLRDSLLRAFLKWGIPEKIYLDNGSVYRSDQLAYSLARLNCKLIHSRPYYSEGRGLIERWWQLAQQFESEVEARGEILPLPELNSFWEAFREQRYCQAIHSELGKTPAEAVHGLRGRPIDLAVVRELFLVREDRKVDKKTGCVSVLHRPFLCESFLRGRRVEVLYDPDDLSGVTIFSKGQRIQRALPQPLNALPEPHQEPNKNPEPSTDYLALLRAQHDQQLLEHARAHSYAEIAPDPTFGHESFRVVVADLAGLSPLRPAALAELDSFWESFGPLPEALVRHALEHAVRLHGRKRHVRVYLDVLRLLVIATFRNPNNEGT